MIEEEDGEADFALGATTATGGKGLVTYPGKNSLLYLYELLRH